MSYRSWFNEHGNKHKVIIDKLIAADYSKEMIIEYFDFENMVKHENDFCVLYQEPKKCHDMEKLNCYMCACPNFRFDDEGIKPYADKTIMSECDIDNGEEFAHDDKIHQNCASCTVPHHEAYVAKNFSLDWFEMMGECDIQIVKTKETDK